MRLIPRPHHSASRILRMEPATKTMTTTGCGIRAQGALDILCTLAKYERARCRYGSPGEKALAPPRRYIRPIDSDRAARSVRRKMKKRKKNLPGTTVFEAGENEIVGRTSERTTTWTLHPRDRRE